MAFGIVDHLARFDFVVMELLECAHDLLPFQTARWTIDPLPCKLPAPAGIATIRTIRIAPRSARVRAPIPGPQARPQR
jgi:hypothetical protein